MLSRAFQPISSGPFLSQPLVIEEDELEGAPRLIGAREGSVILGRGDIAFAKGMPADKGDKWQIYRPGKKFIDPDTDEVLGVEAVYLGNAEIDGVCGYQHHCDHSFRGRNLSGRPAGCGLQWRQGPYLPRAPETNIAASVISVYGGVSQAGQNAAIVLNKGARDGLEVGHVLALYQKGEIVRERRRSFFNTNTHTLPDERYGLVFVFRVFNKVSYALVMQTKLPVQLLDRAQTP